MSNTDLAPVLISGVSCCERDGTAYLRLEDVARGLGFTEKKGDVEYIMWRRVDRYLDELHFGTSAERPQRSPARGRFISSTCSLRPRKCVLPPRRAGCAAQRAKGRSTKK